MRESTLEALENRQLMSGATASVNDAGVLTVTGTAANETILLNTTNYSSQLNVFVATGNTGYSIGSFKSFELKRVDVHGGAGNDTILLDATFSAPAAVFGDAGNDTIRGATHGDYLYGGEGDDDIDGGFGNDYILGQGGNDVIRDSSDNFKTGSGADNVWGGSGIDRIDYGWRQWSGVTICLDGSATSGIAGEKDRLHNDIERATGTSFADVIVGTKSANVLQGLAGNDTIYGLDGDDRLFGDTGDDLINGGAGKDYIAGGKGNDTFWALDSKGGDTVWGDNYGVYVNKTFADLAYVDDSVTNDLTYCTAKNYWVKS